jgi:murein DD-endopeptidase MepM/ murein hydrolase activator NlpD
VEAYGERSNPETGTVTINPGINIGAALGSAVTAAEDGTVSLVSWLPSYGTIVIVEHRGGYRTVYGNLAATAITRGTIVGAGDRIGTVGATLGGSFLHFEVWKGQTRLNPMSVLRGA